jgi:hypothetical protein
MLVLAGSPGGPEVPGMVMDEDCVRYSRFHTFSIHIMQLPQKNPWFALPGMGTMNRNLHCHWGL